MPIEAHSDNEVLFVLDDNMLVAGVEQLRQLDSRKDSPYEAVARIYCAMEMVRIAIRDAMGGEFPPMDKSKLN